MVVRVDGYLEPRSDSPDTYWDQQRARDCIIQRSNQIYAEENGSSYQNLWERVISLLGYKLKATGGWLKWPLPDSMTATNDSIMLNVTARRWSINAFSILQQGKSNNDHIIVNSKKSYLWKRLSLSITPLMWFFTKSPAGQYPHTIQSTHRETINVPCACVHIHILCQ